MNKPKNPPAMGAEMGGGAGASTDSAVENPKANEAPPTIDHISDLIEAAATRVASKPEFIDQIVDAVIAKTDFDKLTGDAVASKLPTSVALKEAVDAAVKGIDLPKLVAETIDNLAEVEAAAQRAAQEQEQADALQRQRAAGAETRKAERAVAAAEDAATVKRQKAADRAEREYVELVAKPIATNIEIRTASSIELRFANGVTFLPEYALADIEADQVAIEDGRPILMLDVEPPRDLVPFEASEAILIVEGGAEDEPIGVWRAELYPPARVGGGAQPRFPSGSLAFRKVEPVPASEDAAEA